MRDSLGVGIALAGLVCCAIGWVGAIFGPKALFAFGVVGFGLSLFGHLLVRRVKRPHLATAPSWAIASLWLARIVAGILVVLSLVTMFASSGAGGVADFPALEVRPTYELNNHGHHTQVSRTRYILASASFSTGWLAIAALANLEALGRVLGGASGPTSQGRRTTR